VKTSVTNGFERLSFSFSSRYALKLEFLLPGKSRQSKSSVGEVFQAIQVLKRFKAIEKDATIQYDLVAISSVAWCAEI